MRMILRKWPLKCRSKVGADVIKRKIKNALYELYLLAKFQRNTLIWQSTHPFGLRVKLSLSLYFNSAAPPQIMDLSDIHMDKGHGVQCSAEGVPTPTIYWYSCHSSQRQARHSTAKHRGLIGAFILNTHLHFSFRQVPLEVSTACMSPVNSSGKC